MAERWRFWCVYTGCLGVKRAGSEYHFCPKTCISNLPAFAQNFKT
jgi:hypothetical protein